MAVDSMFAGHPPRRIVPLDRRWRTSWRGEIEEGSFDWVARPHKSREKQRRATPLRMTQYTKDGKPARSHTEIVVQRIDEIVDL